MNILNKQLKSLGNATQPVNFFSRSQWIDCVNAAEEKINELEERMKETFRMQHREKKIYTIQKRVRIMKNQAKISTYNYFFFQHTTIKISRKGLEKEERVIIKKIMICFIVK